ncbi:MAG: hypothetical protein ACYSUL_02070 [Planctomycetota bacterium]
MNITRHLKTRLRFTQLYLFVVLLCIIFVPQAFGKTSPGEFKAVGPREPVKLEPWTQGAVEVFFENQPTSLRFNMPAYPCMVTENNIQYVTFGCETYDPRVGRKSFEPQQDLDNTYNRFHHCSVSRSA